MKSTMLMSGSLSQESSERYERLFKMLLDAIPSSVLLINSDLRIISANRNFLEKSRRSMANTIGFKLESIFPLILLDQMDMASRIRQVFGTNQSTRGERMTYRAPGIPMRIYYCKILPFSWSGIVESVMLLMDDVTEQVMLSKEIHRVERHLASVVECASDFILSTDTEGRILTWNRAAERLSGYSLEEVRGRFFFEFFAEAHQKEVQKAFSDMISGEKSLMAEWDITTKNGERLLVSLVYSPMNDDQGHIGGIVVVGRDLSERRKIELQLLQSQKLAALGVMAGGIAHEIRNPLAICSSAAQFLLEDRVTPDFQKECATKIRSSIQRVSAIIENLLRFARPSPTTNMIHVNLLSILKETLMLISNQARIQKIELKASLPEDPIWVRGISSLLQQVFMNIFLNAINSMAEGGTLHVSAERLDVEILVRVSDTGKGISSMEIDKIFDPFYTTAPAGKGTGLGLSICYSIVKQHCGSIEVNSQEGKGSAFLVRFPIL